jgi:hypothetical protein
MKTWLRRSAGLGAAAWVVVAAVAPFGLLEKLFLLAPLVLVPLAFALIEPAPWMSAVLQPIAAAAATAAFFVPPGFVAAGLATPWAVLTGVAALEGLMRLRSFAREELVLTLALFMLPVGGFWLVATRAGFAPMGFAEPIVLLTAVHFHYTVFLAPLLAVLAGRGRRLFLLAGPGLLAGTVLLAVGFVVSPVLKLAAAALLVAAAGAVAILQLQARRGMASRPARILLALSGASLLAGMAIAGAYELGFYTGAAWLSIPEVARSHGPLNGLGFALAGLVAWTLERG